MRKITLTLCVIIASATTLFATSLYSTAEDKPITYDKLPAGAQDFISQHFAEEEVSHAILDRDVISIDYRVAFLSGTKLEFNSKGEWKEVDTRNGIVPSALVPQQITEYVKANYPNQEITEIKRNHYYTEVTLKSGLELTFNRGYQLVDVDD